MNYLTSILVRLIIRYNETVKRSRMNLDISNNWFAWLIVLAVWDITWRGLALWRASQLKNRNWFIALLVINSVGILPIFYLYNTKDVDHR